VPNFCGGLDFKRVGQVDFVGYVVSWGCSIGSQTVTQDSTDDEFRYYYIEWTYDEDDSDYVADDPAPEIDSFAHSP